MDADLQAAGKNASGYYQDPASWRFDFKFEI
jgi:hypothetical protein